MQLPWSAVAAAACMTILSPIAAAEVRAHEPISESDPDALRAANSNMALDGIADEFPGLSAAVWTPDGIVWHAERGTRSIMTSEPVTPQTRFNIYSTSKALLAFAIARLAAREGISLDLTVGEIAPDMPAAWHPISLRQILSHRSGIRHYSSAQDWLSFAQMQCASPIDALAHFSADPLVNEPGEAENYSSFAFVLASELLVRLSSESDFDAALNDALDLPFKFSLDNLDRERPELLIDAGRLPESMRPAGAQGIIAMPPLSAECKFGAGGLIASASDLAQAGGLSLVGADNVLRPIDISEAQPNSIWLAGAIRRFEFGGTIHVTYSLSGGAPGGRSYLLVLPEAGISIALTANFDGPSLENTAHAIAEVWLTQTAD